MRTPINVLLMAVFYWLAIYAVTIIPVIARNYHLNLIWMVLVVPNILRLIIGSVPKLAVDRMFFLASTLIALILTYAINLISKETKEAIKDHSTDRNKKLKMSALLMGTFAAGALITYAAGIDKSIYSNMGWETRR